MIAPAPRPDPGALQRHRLRQGTLGFAVLTLAGLTGLFVLAAPEGTPLRLADLRPGVLVLALAAALLDAVLGGLRFQIFIRRMHPRSPLWLAVRADLAGRFVGAVTPSQSGGGPAQVFVLRRGGIPVPEALSLLLVNLISTLSFFVLAGGLSAWAFRDLLGHGTLRSLFQYGLVAVALLLAAMVAALVRPDVVSRPLASLARRSAPGNETPCSLAARAAGALVASLEQYRLACDHFVRRNPWLPLASFGLTMLIYANKFAMAWLVMRGLGVERDLATTLALLALVHFCTFLAPSPGGSGIAELATGAFVSILLPGALVGPFTLLYRTLIVYLPAAVGALLLLDELGTARPRGPSAAQPSPRAPRAQGASPPRWSSPRRVPLALLLGGSLAAAVSTTASDGPCPLCAPGAPASTPLAGAELQAAAEALAERNRRETTRIDTLLREGRLGRADSQEARERAQLLARVTLANWYAFLLPFVSDHDRVGTVRREDLEPVVARYCEAVVVPLPRLRELRLGRGHVCARYDLGGPDTNGWTVLGGRRLPYRVGDREVGGVTRRILGLDWGSAGMGSVEVLVAEHYGFRLEAESLTWPDGSHADLFLALDVAGAWVQRCGVHRPTAFAFWATRPSDEPPYLPRTARVGSAIYLPGLKLALPLLPDIDLDDMRVLGLPMPFLDAGDLRRGVLPSWLPCERDLTLASWTGEGPPPPGLLAHLSTPRTSSRRRKRSGDGPGPG